jgi:uridine kinase
MKGDKLVIQEWHIKAARRIMKLLFPQITKSQNRFSITIAGESGSGKSEIAAVLSDLLSEKGIKSIILQQDDYFVYPPKTNAKMRRKNIGHVGLSEVHLELLDENLKDITEGKSEIEKPLVIFDEDRITKETVKLEGIKAVIIDGTYTTILKNAHQRIFIDRTYVDTRKARKQRAREEQDEFLEKILQIEHRIISSHKPQADIIVTNNYEVKQVRKSEGKRGQQN